MDPENYKNTGVSLVGILGIWWVCMTFVPGLAWRFCVMFQPGFAPNFEELKGNDDYVVGNTCVVGLLLVKLNLLTKCPVNPFVSWDNI